MYPHQIIATKNKRKLSMLTAYDYNTALILNESKIDMILVGDSLSNVMLGNKDTIMVTLDEMIHHGKSVVKGAKDKFVIVDMPFMSVSCGFEDAMKNVQRVMQETGAQAVKIEGAENEILNIMGKLNQCGVPVMGHLGLTPQSYLTIGGYKKQGVTEESANKIINDAKALQEAGVFGLVLECIPTELARKITNEISIPTIGIGSGTETDGQVVVINDLLGLTPKDQTPSFVKRKMELFSAITETVNDYVSFVEGGK